MAPDGRGPGEGIGGPQKGRGSAVKDPVRCTLPGRGGSGGSPEGSHQAGSMAAASEAASTQKHGPIQAASRQPTQPVRLNNPADRKVKTTSTARSTKTTIQQPLSKLPKIQSPTKTNPIVPILPEKTTPPATARKPKNLTPSEGQKPPHPPLASSARWAGSHPWAEDLPRKQSPQRC